jgi:hypothetical protein
MRFDSYHRGCLAGGDGHPAERGHEAHDRQEGEREGKCHWKHHFAPVPNITP